MNVTVQVDWSRISLTGKSQEAKRFSRIAVLIVRYGQIQCGQNRNKYNYQKYILL